MLTTHITAGEVGANVIDHFDAGSQPHAPYKVDVSQGALNSDVSRQWAGRPADQKFDTLSDLYDFKRNVWETSFDVMLRSAEITASHPDLDFDRDDMTDAQAAAEAARRMSRLTVQYKAPHGGDAQSLIEVAPTHYSFSQLTKLANFSARELRKLPTKIACDILNWQLRYGAASQECKVWTGTEEMRAVQGPNYGRIGDHEIVKALMTIAGDGKGDDHRFHWKAPGRIDWANGTYDPEAMGPVGDRTFYGSDRDMFCFLVDDRRPIVVGKTRDGNDDVMFRGFYVQNSMVGARTLKLATFYLRGVCMNRNLWGVEKFAETTIRHTSGAPERWLQEVQPALESFARGSDQTLIKGVERAKAKVLVEKEIDAMKYLNKSLSFSEAQAKAIIETGEREEGRKPRTVWDFGQAITAFARGANNSDDRLNIELVAKRVFDKVA